MNQTNPNGGAVHQGRNIKRFRELAGMKQEALAAELGEDWNQRRVSLLEAKEEVEPAIIEQVARILNVPAEAIKNMEDNGAIQIISSTFHDNSSIVNQNCTLNINPTEKWLAALEENKTLYERLLKSEQDKVALLEKVLERK